MIQQGMPSATQAKQCHRCAAVKALDDFHRDRCARDGHMSVCKSCKLAAMNARYWQNPERARERARTAYWANPEQGREKTKQWLLANPEKVRAYLDRTVQKRLEQCKTRRKQTPLSEKGRVGNNRRTRRWRTNHPGAGAETFRRWRLLNPDKVLAQKERRRARKLNATGTITGAQWRAVREAFGNRCLACQATERIEMDHVVPLGAGGNHDPWNVQPLCRVCNARKASQSTDYRPLGWQVLLERGFHARGGAVAA